MSNFEKSVKGATKVKVSHNLRFNTSTPWQVILIARTACGTQIQIHREYLGSDSYRRCGRCRDLSNLAYSTSRIDMDGGVQGAHCDPSYDPRGSIGRYVALSLGQPEQACY